MRSVINWRTTRISPKTQTCKNSYRQILIRNTRRRQTKTHGRTSRRVICISPYLKTSTRHPRVFLRQFAKNLTPCAASWKISRRNNSNRLFSRWRKWTNCLQIETPSRVFLMILRNISNLHPSAPNWKKTISSLPKKNTVLKIEA